MLKVGDKIRIIRNASDYKGMYGKVGQIKEIRGMNFILDILNPWGNYCILSSITQDRNDWWEKVTNQQMDFSFTECIK
jgi:hypothetical protein